MLIYPNQWYNKIPRILDIIYSFWPTSDICLHGPWPMVLWFLTTPKYHPIWCWLFVIKIWNSWKASQHICSGNTRTSSQWNMIKTILWISESGLFPRANGLTWFALVWRIYVWQIYFSQLNQTHWQRSSVMACQRVISTSVCEDALSFWLHLMSYHGYA